MVIQVAVVFFRKVFTAVVVVAPGKAKAGGDPSVHYLDDDALVCFVVVGDLVRGNAMGNQHLLDAGDEGALAGGRARAPSDCPGKIPPG